MKIKVCGMLHERNVADAVSLGIDYMGFIFYPPSPRYCGKILRKETVDKIGRETEPVAVTVNMDEEEILQIAGSYGFRTFQLHGDETPEMCRRLRAKGMKVIKAFGIHDRTDLGKLDEYSGNVDFFLFDTATTARGGSGRRFDWKILDSYSLPEPFFLSGGINPEATLDIISFEHPTLEGIDLNSRFEIAPGVKDIDRLRVFIEKIKGEKR